MGLEDLNLLGKFDSLRGHVEDSLTDLASKFFLEVKKPNPQDICITTKTIGSRGRIRGGAVILKLATVRKIKYVAGRRNRAGQSRPPSRPEIEPSKAAGGAK